MKIEKGIPVRKIRSKFQDFVKKMEIGDSVFVKNNKDRVALKKAIYKDGFLGITRSEGKGFRVWKRPRKKTFIFDQ